MLPEARQQRCCFHKTANVLAALPKSAHPGAKKALAEIWNAEDKDHARAAVKAFAAACGAKFPKAVAKVTNDQDELLAFYDFPAEHWVKRWRMVNAPHLVALVRAGATLVNGKLAERPAGDAPRAAKPGASDDSSRDPGQ